MDFNFLKDKKIMFSCVFAIGFEYCFSEMIKRHPSPKKKQWMRYGTQYISE